MVPGTDSEFLSQATLSGSAIPRQEWTVDPWLRNTMVARRSAEAGQLASFLSAHSVAQPCLSTRGPGRPCRGTGCRSAARRCG